MNVVWFVCSFVSPLNPVYILSFMVHFFWGGGEIKIMLCYDVHCEFLVLLKLFETCYTMSYNVHFLREIKIMFCSVLLCFVAQYCACSPVFCCLSPFLKCVTVRWFRYTSDSEPLIDGWAKGLSRLVSTTR